MLGLVIVFDFFGGGEGIGVGDVKWNVFRFVGCFIAATSTSSTSRDDDVERGCGLGLISRGMGSEWKSFIIDWDPDDRVFVINWDHNCFMVDVNGFGVFSLPCSPVILDIEVSSSNKGSEEVELIVVGMHADEDDSIISAQGEDGRGGKS